MAVFSRPVKDAFDKLLQREYPLVSGKPVDVKSFRFAYEDTQKKSKGSWKDTAGDEVTVSLIGMVDVQNSKFGAYGNMYVPQDKFPTIGGLRGCKFVLSITIPDVDDEDSEHELCVKLKYQFRQLSVLANQLERTEGRVSKTNSWIKVMKDDSSMKGWISVSLGNVFTSVETPGSVDEFMNFSPKKKKDANAAPEEKIVLDPKGWFNTLEPAHRASLQHNPRLPVFHSNGKRVGRTANDLQSALWDGRWVTIEATPVVWDIADHGVKTRSLQLIATKVSLIDDDDDIGMLGVTQATTSGQQHLGPVVHLDHIGLPDIPPHAHPDEDGDETSTLSDKSPPANGSPLKRKADAGSNDEKDKEAGKKDPKMKKLTK